MFAVLGEVGTARIPVLADRRGLRCSTVGTTRPRRGCSGMATRTYTRTDVIASDLDDLGITQGHVKAWLLANPHRGRNLRRALALVKGGHFPPQVSGRGVPSYGADYLNSAADDADCTQIELLEEIAAMEPVAGLIEAHTSECQDWSAMNSRLAVG